MNKTLLIIQREYFSRVRKKSFLLMTFLVPLLFVGMMGLVAYLTHQGGDEVTTVEVIDKSGYFEGKLKDTRNIHFTRSLNGDPAKAKTEALKRDVFILFIPADIETGGQPELASEKRAPLNAMSEIERQMDEILRTRMLISAGIDPSTLNSIKPSISITAKELTDEGERDSNTEATFIVSLAAAILIYLCLFVYGAQVMRGVIEEKTSRVVEVLISSVKPFQLMLGKIIGIGLVGLTQFLLWITLTVSLGIVTGNQVLQSRIETVQQLDKKGLEGPDVSIAPGNPESDSITAALQSIPLTYILSVFLVYFLGGYLLYSALFAAVGSAVDTETETQQFMFPITLPLLFTYIMSFSFITSNPNSTLSVWLSMIPLTSPIAMMVRLPFGVPAWQLGLSIFLLIGGFIFTVWLAARIYRVGILMYGKKASYRELMKWLMYKG